MTAPDLSASQRILLWQAVEDYGGLWESPWELRALYPSASEESLVLEATNVVSELLAMGLVRLYSSQEPYGEMRLLPDAKAFELLSTSDVWKVPPPRAVSVRFSATEEAAAVFFKRDSP
ncbi:MULTISPECIES: hypothetical protein [Micrococcaceae]|uniref:hypothetical protein n=1 Tax=Micrococcaceae TaxID=1268 RepID=UPI00047A0FEC|nr:MULTISPECIES: hypothetical protein [Micrococcaceae]BCW57665.1 hypothetical protein StoSoilB20_10120 [Arthrobacter sp. StoSoilB20]